MQNNYNLSFVHIYNVLIFNKVQYLALLLSVWLFRILAIIPIYRDRCPMEGVKDKNGTMLFYSVWFDDKAMKKVIFVIRFLIVIYYE